MKELIMEAYRKAETKDYSLHDPRTWITTGEVRRILERQGFVFEDGWALA
ncbi:hypothetical protein [Sporomusa sp.]|nr:hypothetical protein [Sporomusa sp.]HWR09597.1 hypothetical protein [Sporomusa sp.]